METSLISPSEAAPRVRADQRRATARRVLPHHGIVRARVRAGHDAAVLNVSAGGALIDTAHRLLPGASIELHLATHDARVALKGRVLRSIVSAVNPGSVRYRGAICFDHYLPWFVDDDLAMTPARTGRTNAAAGESATRHLL